MQTGEWGCGLEGQWGNGLLGSGDWGRWVQFPPHTHRWLVVSNPVVSYCDEWCRPSLEVFVEMGVGTLGSMVGSGGCWWVGEGDW